MQFDKLRFDHGQLHYELIEALGSFRTLKNLTEDEAAISAYVSGSGRPRSFSATGESFAVSDQDLGKVVDVTIEAVTSAISAYKRQLVVVIVSTIEVAIADAFSVLFAFAPETIKGLNSDSTTDGFKAVISVDELKSATSVDNLRMALVERATTFACQGKNKRTVLRRLGRLFGQEIDTESQRDLLDLVELRNQIVHENAKPDLSTSAIEDSFDKGIKFIAAVGSLVYARSLPLDDPLQMCGGRCPREL